MSCAAICKEIIDNGHAVTRGVSCLAATVAIHAGIEAANRATGKPDSGRPPKDLIDAYRAAGETFALACAALEKSMPLIPPGEEG